MADQHAIKPLKERNIMDLSKLKIEWIENGCKETFVEWMSAQDGIYTCTECGRVYSAKEKHDCCKDGNMTHRFYEDVDVSKLANKLRAKSLIKDD